MQSSREMYSVFSTIFILTLFFRYTYSIFISLYIDNHEQQNTPLKSIADSGFEFQNSQKEWHFFPIIVKANYFHLDFFF